MSQTATSNLSATAERPHSVKRNVLASWVAHGTALGLGFFMMPYVLHILGEEQYGTWVFINAFVSYATLLYLGFGETVSRYVAAFEAQGRPDRVNEVVSLVMAIYAGTGSLALILAGCFIGLAPWFERWDGNELLQVQIVILLFGINLAVSLCGSVYGGVLLGLRRFDVERAVTVVFDFVRFGLIFIFLRETWGLVTIAAIYLFITVSEQVALIILAYRAYPTLRIRFSYLKWSVFKECSSFSGMALVSQLASSLINATDSIVIGIMLGAEAIVPYYVALRLTQFIKQPIDKIAHICMPTAGALGVEADSRRLLRLLLKAVGVVVLLVGGSFIGGWYFGGDLIRLWMGPEFGESQTILRVLLGAQLIALPCGILRAFLFGTGRVRGPALIYMLEAIFNLSLSIVLCWKWGIIGVAWGTAIPVLVVELGLLLPYAIRTFQLPARRLWNEAVFPQIPALMMLALYSWIVAQQPWSGSGWPALIGTTLGGGAVLGATWLLQHKVILRTED